MSEFVSRQELLLREYGAVPVPAPMTTIELDADPTVRETTGEFFDSIVRATRLGQNAVQILLRNEHYCLHPNDARPSDDWDQRLLLEGVQPLAMAHKTRTAFNAMMVTYSKIELTPNAVRQILGFQTTTDQER